MALSGTNFGAGDHYLGLAGEVLGTWFWLIFVDTSLRVRGEAWRVRVSHREGELPLAGLGGGSLGHRSAEISVSYELWPVSELLVPGQAADVSIGPEDVKV